MRLSIKHEWNVKPGQAREIQEDLRKRWEGSDRQGLILTVAGLDAAFVLNGSQAFKEKFSPWKALREANRAIGGVVVFAYPEMIEVERAFTEVALEFPYLPGLLSFREIPVLLAALRKLRRMPDLLFCDGQGYAHPRRMGLATHLGIVLDVPTIGCAKSLLIGKHGEVGRKRSEWAALMDGEEIVGAALRTRDDCKPMYISQGHRVSLQTAVQMTLAVDSGTRVPRPTREADRFVSEVKERGKEG